MSNRLTAFWTIRASDLLRQHVQYGGSLLVLTFSAPPAKANLTNLLTDLPEMAIATDRVDSELVREPRRWDIRFIRKFMITFGIVSSAFDYLTFGALVFLLHADIDHFRTGWFLESVISASLIVLIIRTRKPLFKSEPSMSLLATLVVAAGTLVSPYTGFGQLFGLMPMPVEFLIAVVGILSLYIFAAEVVKRVFYQKVRF
jgi:Mg2+-importing ATPase